MKKERTNSRNGFLRKKSSLHFTQFTKKNHKITIGEKLLVSRGFILACYWRKKIELRERKRKYLLLEDILIVEDSFYR